MQTSFCNDTILYDLVGSGGVLLMLLNVMSFPVIPVKGVHKKVRCLRRRLSP